MGKITGKINQTCLHILIFTWLKNRKTLTKHNKLHIFLGIFSTMYSGNILKKALDIMNAATEVE